MSSELSGYLGRALQLLSKVGASVGDLVRVTKDGEAVEGILMPRALARDDRHIVIKMRTGYNVGVRLTDDTKVEVLGPGAKPAFVRPPRPPEREDLPRVAIISTGGTIASKVDYRTGAVEPALTAEDLYSVVPELSSIARVKAEILYNVFSEDLDPTHWMGMAEAISREIADGADGVVVAQGTDTLGYSGAAMSFALQNPPVPVVLVGAQRSSDRPSSDAASNLIGSVAIAAKAPFGEVVVAMHDSSSDESIVAHRGTKVRKCHTSRRDAFRSVNSRPLARLKLPRMDLEMLTSNFSRRGKAQGLAGNSKFDWRVTLVKFHPGFSPKLIQWLVESDYRGIVLEGTGLGHVSEGCFGAIGRAVKKGMVVGMTSQCLWGRVHMNVYSRGHDLTNLGVVPLGDMLPETALVKMMWAFGQTSDAERVKEIMLTNVAHEFSERRVAGEEGYEPD